MEYQAKELFAKHDVPVTLGIVAHTPDEAQAAAEKLGVVVVKAQVKAGGRLFRNDNGVLTEETKAP